MARRLTVYVALRFRKMYQWPKCHRKMRQLVIILKTRPNSEKTRYQNVLLNVSILHLKNTEFEQKSNLLKFKKSLAELYVFRIHLPLNLGII